MAIQNFADLPTGYSIISLTNSGMTAKQLSLRKNAIYNRTGRRRVVAGYVVVDFSEPFSGLISPFQRCHVFARLMASS